METRSSSARYGKMTTLYVTPWSRLSLWLSRMIRSKCCMARTRSYRCERWRILYGRALRWRAKAEKLVATKSGYGAGRRYNDLKYRAWSDRGSLAGLLQRALRAVAS